MSTSGTGLPVDACAVLLRATALLAADGPDALPAALAAIVADCGLRSAVLRSAGPDAVLLAVAGDVVHAVPHSRDGGSDSASVELPVEGAGRPLGALTVVGATAADLPVLRACAAVLGLVLARPDRLRDDDVVADLLAAADADADAAADDLHDGPVQDLVVARLAADAAARGGDPVWARDAVHGALQSLRRALWMTRPRGTGDGGLPAALAQLSERLVESGHPALALQLDEDACAQLPPAAASTCYRLAQSVATGDRPTAVRVTRRGTTVRLEVDGAVPPAVPDRWAARARALSAQLALDPAGRLVLSVPVGVPDPTPDTEAIP